MLKLIIIRLPDVAVRVTVTHKLGCKAWDVVCTDSPAIGALQDSIVAAI